MIIPFIKKKSTDLSLNDCNEFFSMRKSTCKTVEGLKKIVDGDGSCLFPFN